MDLTMRQKRAFPIRYSAVLQSSGIATLFPLVAGILPGYEIVVPDSKALREFQSWKRTLNREQLHDLNQRLVR